MATIIDHQRARVALFIPYFGKWPEYFEFYLYTCSKNPVIDFYYFTDCPIPQKIYSNTIFQSISFSEYCQKVSDILGINFYPQNPFKLADLKPFYSIIHKDIASQYEFWGFGDIDLVYGDMTTILSEINLKQYDAFSTHIDKISGHFCTLRYSKYHNIAFQINEWKDFLEDGKNHNLDENYLARLIYPEQRVRRGLKRYVKFKFCRPLWEIPIPTLIQRCLRKYEREWYTSPIPTQETKYIYRDNKIYNNITNTELPYLHFIFFKNNPMYKHLFYYKRDNIFYQITPNDFGGKIEITRDYIKKL